MTGFAITGSFCTHSRALAEMKKLRETGVDLVPIFSECAYSTDTRFGSANNTVKEAEEICGRSVVHTITESEKFGPAVRLDALIIAPCTGNTAAKIVAGITDTAVCMAAKAHLRRSAPLLLAVATNDALGANLSNIAALLNRKSIYLVPMHQDDPVGKPHSLVADFSSLPEAYKAMLEGRQLRPVFV